MLMQVHVRNFALIEKADLELGKGLNILTGETGAGKSILIDAVNAALGGKCNASMIRHGEEAAYVELVFFFEDQDRLQDLKNSYDLDMEDGTLIISRKIMKNRSLFKVNDKTVTAASVRAITGGLMDLHGQHDHQSLLYKSKHLEIIDAYAGEDLKTYKDQLSGAYKKYMDARKELALFTMEEEERIREKDFLTFEVNEIYAADLKPGEEEELSDLWKKMSNSCNIMESLSQAHELLSYDQVSGAGSQISMALSRMSEALRYDENLGQICSQLQDLESILSDLNRDLSFYMEDMTFDPESFSQISQRLDQIRSMEMKYGRNYQEIMDQLEKKEARIRALEDYEENRQKAMDMCLAAKEEALALCSKVSDVRKACAGPLVQAITTSLQELNFLQVSFDIDFRQTGDFNGNGYDEAEFLLSTNPGQPMMALGQVASGGELSRIMLAVKAVLADMDQIPTLIFDEIDTGISGRTAACVSEKLVEIAGCHQVICITHLPQIAAGADHHFMIEKGTADQSARTDIRQLGEEESTRELARLLGGVEVTEAALENARALKRGFFQN